MFFNAQSQKKTNRVRRQETKPIRYHFAIVPVGPILNIACIFGLTQQKVMIEQDKKQRRAWGELADKDQLKLTGTPQASKRMTLISTKRYQVSLATAFSKQKVVGFDTVKLWNVLSWCIINYTVSWLQCLSLAWEQNCTALLLCGSLLWYPLLLSQGNSQADPVLDLAVSFTEILLISSSCEQTAFLPESGLITLIIVAPEAVEGRHSRWIWIVTKPLTE